MSKVISQNWLGLKPAIKVGISSVTNEDGLISIVIPRFKSIWMAKLFLPKNKKNEIQLKLDKNGTLVWLLIDGKKNVRDILNELSHMEEEENQFKERVLIFLQNLYRNGFITVNE